MKALVVPHYGPASSLAFRELPLPEPRAGEIRVRIHACSLNAADWHVYRADPFLVRLMMGPFRPNIKGPGFDISGEVDAVGEGVTRWKPGDEVIGDLFPSKGGGCADYTCAPASIFAAKPKAMSHEEACTLGVAAGTALYALRDLAKVQAGQHVLIHGASGGVGIFAVQLAHYYGAQVTALCSAGKAEQARALGADRVLDYAREDFAAAGPYDVILGVNGYAPLRKYRDALKPGGIYLMTGGTGKQMAEAILLAPWLRKHGKILSHADTKPTQERTEFLAKLAEEGKLVTVIDRVYPLDEAVQAFEHLEQGHARGKIVVKVL